MTSSLLPSKNSALVILLFLAFSRASKTAASTISIPYTFLTFFAANKLIVPIPQ